MPDTTGTWTTAMLATLPDDGSRYEIVDGELFVTPAPAWRHQRAVGELHRLLAASLPTDAAADIIFAPADVVLDSRTLVQPDLFVVPLNEGRSPEDSSEAGTLLLAVEVLSPSSARADRHVKRRRYQRADVAEYWVVDLDARLVERWRPGDERPELIVGQLEWSPASTSARVVIDLPAMFAKVLDGRR